jgi:hypothetical protein
MLLVDCQTSRSNTVDEGNYQDDAAIGNQRGFPMARRRCWLAKHESSDAAMNLSK